MRDKGRKGEGAGKKEREGRREDGRKGVEEERGRERGDSIVSPEAPAAAPTRPWPAILGHLPPLLSSSEEVPCRCVLPTGFLWSWLTCSREGMTPGRQEEGQLPVGERPASY